MPALPSNPEASLHYKTGVMALFSQHCPNKPALGRFYTNMLRAQKKSDGQTGTQILLEAMSNDKVHLARFVLDALDGRIVDSKTENAQTPLISSILLPDRLTRCKFLELLLQRGAAVNSQDAAGRTALSHACERGCLDAVKILIRNNADPEIEDAAGNTALMYAAAGGHCAVVEFLVRAFKRLGLQIHRQNKAGNSAVEVAKFLGHARCISALTPRARRKSGSEGGEDEDEKFEVNLAGLVNKLEDLQTLNHTKRDLSQRPRLKQTRLPSMDSIEEFEREEGSASSSSQELIFSAVLTPKPPPRSLDSSPNSNQRDRGSLTLSEDLLPPLTRTCEPQKSLFLSPRPIRNSQSRTSLTPDLDDRKKKGQESEKSKMSNFASRFHESYYQKRFSLPTSILSPTPPQRALVPLCKSRTERRRASSPRRTVPVTSTSTLSVLSSKLLRRFTSPEFQKDVREMDEGPVVNLARMPRSETFPQVMKHPKVGSKASVDSISAVKCEFDFQLRVPKC